MAPKPQPWQFFASHTSRRNQPGRAVQSGGIRLGLRAVVVLVMVAATHTPAWPQAPDRWQTLRDEMTENTLEKAGITHPRVLEAMRATPRHRFLPRNLWNQAYFDMALPIGEQQTISSPFIVAFMTECLDPSPTDHVLEVGTGSGYQAAVLSGLVEKVYTVEIVEALGRQATRVLRELRYDNVAVKVGDGFQGWPEFAPFDKIIVTCSPENVPQPLVDQLKEGGRMVIPVGERYQQTLYLFRKVNGRLEQESLRPTLFVPMTGRAEQQREIQPDPSRPRLVNASFEDLADEKGFVPGWYYQRQMVQVTADDAPDGRRYVRFQNSTPGQDAHVMQGLAIDGRTVPQLRVGCWVKTEGVAIRNPRIEGARVVISFYDHERRDLGVRWLGPWRGDGPWQQYAKEIPVPATTREMIVRIGLFGATGSAAFDQLTLDVLP